MEGIAHLRLQRPGKSGRGSQWHPRLRLENAPSPLDLKTDLVYNGVCRLASREAGPATIGLSPYGQPAKLPQQHCRLMDQAIY
jgi:hypothetical protein